MKADSYSTPVEQESIAVEQLMDILGSGDEVGTPDEFIDHCEEHDVLHRKSGRCLRCEEVSDR